MANNGWLPIETEFNWVDEQLDFTVPENWEYIGYSKDDEFIRSSERAGTISCTCNTTGKCVPFEASAGKHKFTGCSGDCTNCTMKQSIAFTTIEFAEMKTGGYLNFTIEPYVVRCNEKLPAAFKAMYEDSEVLEKIQAFYESVYHGEPVPEYEEGEEELLAPEGYSVTMVNICGRATPFLVPDNYLEPNMVAGKGAKCSCTRGNCKIEKISALIGSVVFCDGNCSGTCTLTTKAVDLITFESDTYQY